MTDGTTDGWPYRDGPRVQQAVSHDDEDHPLAPSPRVGSDRADVAELELPAHAAIQASEHDECLLAHLRDEPVPRARRAEIERRIHAQRGKRTAWRGGCGSRGSRGGVVHLVIVG